MNEQYVPADVAVAERPLVDQPQPDTPSAARLADAGGQLVEAVATGMAQIAGNIAGTIAGAMAAPLTAAAATVHADVVDEPQDLDTPAVDASADEPAEPQGPDGDGSVG